jgi:predicted GIY-YIG superfamily endonuclease
MHEAGEPNAVVDFLELSNGDIYVGSTDDLRRRVERSMKKSKRSLATARTPLISVRSKTTFMR